MRLRENVARAIIPPVHVQPWFPPLFLLRPRSFCSRRRVVHNIPAGQETPFQVPSYLNNGLDQGDFSLLTCSSTQIPLRRDPFGHFHLCQIYFGLLSLSLSFSLSLSRTSGCALSTHSFICWADSAFVRNNTGDDDKATEATTFTSDR